MMDVQHIYELAFFFIFGGMFYSLFLPGIKNAIKSYKESQNRENVSLSDTEVRLLREYNKHRKSEDNQDAHTQSFITKINELREEIQQEQSAKNAQKLAAMKGAEQKALEEDIAGAKKMIVSSLVNEIKKNTPESSKDLINNFDAQLDVIKNYFTNA